MGEILGLGLTHYPGFNGRDERMAAALKRTLADPGLPEQYRHPENWPEPMRHEWEEGASAAARHRELCVQQFRKLRQVLDEFRPDFVVVWGDDQYENFRDDIIPPFCVLAYDSAEIRPWAAKQTYVGGQMRRFGFGDNVWDEPEDQAFLVKGHREAAKALTSGLLEEGIDVSYAYQPLHHQGLPHPFVNTLLFLDYDRQGWPYPMVPFQVNCYGRRVISQRAQYPDLANPLSEDQLDPPSPMPWRCFELGQAIARVAARSPWRVALIASSSWSHAFLSPRTHYIYPDLERDHILYDALCAGDYNTWRNYPLSSIEESGQQEILNWECLIGAMAELGRKPDYTAKVETHVYNSTKVFAVFYP